MSKFSSRPARANVLAPVRTTGQRSHTYEGFPGYERDGKSELFLLAVSNMVGESTFYEAKGERDDRFKALVHQCAQEDAAWTAAFIPYLRDTMQMRSASTVAAAHYVHAGAPNGRKVVDAALKRADEPAEILAFYAQEYGRAFPQPLKRGVADAVKRLYNERAALKYDGTSRAWRMGDVIDIVHPKPAADWQSDLYRWLLDVRHHPGEGEIAGSLEAIRAHVALQNIPVEKRRGALDPDTLARAGMTWEALSGWLQGPMDAQAWEAVIPSMGYMALLRNLRNFEQAKVSDLVLGQVAAKLSDPEQVARSRQFPLRFLSAFKSIETERFSWPLQQALEHSVTNIPALKGRTLVLIDVSGSMRDPLSARSDLQRWEAAALFGIALSKRCADATTIAYQSQAWAIRTDQSTLRTVEQLRQMVGGGTQTMQTLQAAYAGHDRVVILTDEQAHYGPTLELPCPVYTFNLGGYRVAHMQSGEKGSYTFGGLTDAGFRMLALLEEQRSVGWPFTGADA